jgi:hypothetical protein
MADPEPDQVTISDQKGILKDILLINTIHSNRQTPRMEKVVIIVNAEIQATGKVSKLSPVTEKMLTALKSAIPNNHSIDVVAAAALWSKNDVSKVNSSDSIYCPLTIQLPHWLDFPAKSVYQSCRDITARRLWVEQKLGYKVSVGDSWLGNLWFPVVFTPKKTLFGQVIGEGIMPNVYEQPIPLGDNARKSLQELAKQLLASISATPSVYLLQFRLLEEEIVFDRLWPFPAAPALTSLTVQQPDLYTCYWKCLTQQGISELVVKL